MTCIVESQSIRPLREFFEKMDFSLLVHPAYATALVRCIIDLTVQVLCSEKIEGFRVKMDKTAEKIKKKRKFNHEMV